MSTDSFEAFLGRASWQRGIIFWTWDRSIFGHSERQGQTNMPRAYIMAYIERNEVVSIDSVTFWGAWGVSADNCREQETVDIGDT